MYEAWQADPNSVHETWRNYFENLEQGIAYDEGAYCNPSVVPGSRAAVATAQGAVTVSSSQVRFVYFSVEALFAGRLREFWLEVEKSRSSFDRQIDDSGSSGDCSGKLSRSESQSIA